MHALAAGEAPSAAASYYRELAAFLMAELGTQPAQPLQELYARLSV